MFDWQIPGNQPTPNELLMEELDQPPSRRLPSSAPAADRVPSRNTGADRTVAPCNARPVGRTDSFPRPAGHPNLPTKEPQQP